MLLAILDPEGSTRRKARRIRRRVYQNKVSYHQQFLQNEHHSIIHYRDQIMYGISMDMTS